MQMYKGLPIITNKVSKAEKQNIPHHIFDQIGLGERPWTVSNFRKEAHKIICEIRSRGRLPVLVGGTHYYTKAVLFNDYLLAGEDAYYGSEEDSRERFPILEAPTSDILSELRKVDPKIASRWHPSDRRKIQRSLEIWLQTGKTASQTYEEQSQRRLDLRGREPSDDSDPSTAYSSLIFWLRANDKVLKERLDNRVNTMLASGLLQEAQAIAASERELNNAGIVLDKTKGIWASIGYKETEPYITALNSNSKPETALAAIKASCIEATKGATRRYARRQDRWIRTHISDALTESDAMDTLYPLDCTNLSDWDINVQHPAFEVTQSFLAGRARPAPESLSDMARETIGSIRAEVENGNTRECRYCDVCDKTLMTEKEWNSHLRSNTHKKGLAGRKKWERFKAWEARQAGVMEEDKHSQQLDQHS
jgi:tRNA dimethylallyltransferase